MLIPNRKRIGIKVLFDILYFGCAIAIYFVDVFQYMDHYYIGLTYIAYEYSYSGLDALVTASFDDFESHFCDKDTGALSEICDNKDDWEIAGIIFIVVSSIAHLIMVYGMLNLFGKACKCTLWGTLKLSMLHYIYSAVYAAGVIAYVLISGIFTLTPPKGYSSDYDIKVQPGIVLMFLSAFFAILSVLYYLLYKKSMNSEPFVVENEYKSLPENKEENKRQENPQKQSFGKKIAQKYEEEKKEEVSRMSSEFSDTIEFDKDAISNEESKSQKSEDKKSQKSDDKKSQKSNEKKKISGK